MKPLLPLAFVDLETTGGAVTHDRITEIAIVTLDNGVATRWSQLVNPECRLPPFITQLTGISDAMLADAPKFGDIAEAVLARLAGCLFVAHNARFDYGFLKNEFKRLGLAFHMPVLCTVKLSRTLFPGHGHHDLDSLIARHALQVTARHRALGDAQAICDFWNLLGREFDVSHLANVVQALVARPSVPPHLDPQALEDLPQGCGVYLFYGENDLPLYVGKSKRIRQRVLAHFAGDHAAAKEMSLSQQVRRLAWIACAGEIEALLTEARLIKAMQPILNRQLRRNRSQCAWQLVDQGFGLWQPRLVYARDLDLGRQLNLHGLFSSRKSALDAIDALAEEHTLCRVLLGIEKGRLGKPCFARQLHRCHGGCLGEESPQAHSERLAAALTELALVAWPFAGPAILEEGDHRHVVDGWCYLGVATDDEAARGLLSQGVRDFDRDTYRILVKHVDRFRPLTGES